MCPKFRTNPVLKYTQCHISTNLSNFLKLCLLYCQKLFALASPNRRSLKKISLVGTLVWPCGKNSAWIISRTSKKAISITLVLELNILAFLGLGDNALFNLRLCHLVSGSYSKIYDSSPVTTLFSRLGSVSSCSKMS